MSAFDGRALLLVILIDVVFITWLVRRTRPVLRLYPHDMVYSPDSRGKHCARCDADGSETGPCPGWKVTER